MSAASPPRSVAGGTPGDLARRSGLPAFRPPVRVGRSPGKVERRQSPRRDPRPRAPRRIGEPGFPRVLQAFRKDHQTMIATRPTTGLEGGTVLDIAGQRIGGEHFAIIAGPCAVESRSQLLET